MPKVTFGVKKPENTNQNIKAVITYKRMQKGLTAEEVAIAARMKKDKFYYRLRNPDTFRLCELRAIAQKLDIELPLLVMGKLSEGEVS